MTSFMKRLFYKKTAWKIGVGSADIASFPDLVLPSVAAIDADTLPDAAFVADPFLWKEEGVWYLFYESKQKSAAKGVIAMSYSRDLERWEYGGVVLEEPYHLSYPHIFSWEGTLYMIPEGGADRSVKLYRGKPGYRRWEYVRTLLEGEDFRDTTLFIHEGCFYFFTTQNGNDNLYLYTADSLNGELTPHPQNPLCEGDACYARSGGNIIEVSGLIYRFAQDCSRRYGEKLHLLEITELSAERFRQEPVSLFLEPDGKVGYNSRKMHHFGAFLHEGKLTFAIDGEGWAPRFGAFG